jgi:hypothetical protein
MIGLECVTVNVLDVGEGQGDAEESVAKPPAISTSSSIQPLKFGAYNAGHS